MTDSIKIPKELSPLIISQHKFCTKPELEMLLIIAENKISLTRKEDTIIQLSFTNSIFKIE